MLFVANVVYDKMEYLAEAKRETKLFTVTAQSPDEAHDKICYYFDSLERAYETSYRVISIDFATHLE